MSASAIILGIESSCDDTAAAVIADGQLLSSVVSTQLEHQAYGGVVPELASRAHERDIVPVVESALKKAGVTRNELTAVAVTTGPGLIGSLLVGVSFAKALALGLEIPLISVNHLEGHLASLFLEADPPPFPHLSLIVSGGHTQLMRIDGPSDFKLLGKTRDDAAGEAFDKVGKLLGLSFPGGPQIDARSSDGNSSYHQFPRTRLQGFDFSFSGIKTAVLYYLNSFSEEERAAVLDQHLDDLCASFQEAIVDMLIAPVKKALRDNKLRDVGLVGGVSANSRLRERMSDLTDTFGGRTFVPSLEYCMDNAAMIAMAGYHHYLIGKFSPLTTTADPSLAIH